MTVERGIVDTNIVILMANLDMNELPANILITAVTMAELAAGPHHVTEPAERARRIEQLQNAEALFEPLPFDKRAARRYGHIVAAVRQSGRTVRCRQLDLMIAAIASAHRLPLFTVNPDDFAGLAGLLDVHPVSHPVTRR